MLWQLTCGCSVSVIALVLIALRIVMNVDVLLLFVVLLLYFIVVVWCDDVLYVVIVMMDDDDLIYLF